jgi:hypothetical protein
MGKDMNPQVINWKTYASGLMVGFFDLALFGLVITGCKAFRKLSENGEYRLWFSWPSEKRIDREGKETYRDLVTAADPVMRHLQTLVRPQIKALMVGVSGNAGRHTTPEGEDLSQYRSGNDDIPF